MKARPARREAPMSASEAIDRSYLRSRLREEIARADRYGSGFVLIVFESVPASDGVSIRRRIAYALERLEQKLRPSDIIGKAFEDCLVVLLVETDAAGAHDVMIRLRAGLVGSGQWNISSYIYPHDRDAIAGIPLLTAA
jgi:GGDEF domain-containing protein